MSARNSAETMPPRHSIAGLALALVVGLRACIACPVALAAQTSVTPCTEHNPMSESFLGCIRSLIDGTQKANPTGDFFLPSRYADCSKNWRRQKVIKARPPTSTS